MTLPGGIGDVEDKFFGITGDPSDGANTPATMQGWTANVVKELLKQKYIGDNGSGASVFTNPDGPLAQGSDRIFDGIFNAQTAADYANAQLAVINRLIVELFDGSGALNGALWSVDPFGAGGGGIGQDGAGNLVWNQFGGVTEGVDCRYDATVTTTDNVIVSAVMPTAVQAPVSGDASWARLYGRVNEVGTANQDGVFGQVTDSEASIGCINSGAETIFDTQPFTPGSGDSWDLILGDADPYHFQWRRNGITVVNYTDSLHVSPLGGLGSRATGFSMLASARTPFILQTLPGTLAVFSADDN